MVRPAKGRATPDGQAHDRPDHAYANDIDDGIDHGNDEGWMYGHSNDERWTLFLIPSTAMPSYCTRTYELPHAINPRSYCDERFLDLVESPKPNPRYCYRHVDRLLANRVTGPLDVHHLHSTLRMR